MEMESLSETPIRDWPPSAGDRILRALRDTGGDPTERALAAEMAGSLAVLNDDLARALLTVLRSAAESEELRSCAAIALGPILEDLDLGLYEDGLEPAPVAPETAREIQTTLHHLHQDPQVPKEVRRRALEGSIRAPEDWHPEAVRTAWQGDDPDWRLTAVFCMAYLPGFEEEILESLESEDLRLRFEAVRAAGERGLGEAWPHVRAILSDPDPDLDLLFAAIEAAPGVRAEEAEGVLSHLLESDDEELVEATHAAIEFARVLTEDPTR